MSKADDLEKIESSLNLAAKTGSLFVSRDVMEAFKREGIIDRRRQIGIRCVLIELLPPCTMSAMDLPDFDSILLGPFL